MSAQERREETVELVGRAEDAERDLKKFCDSAYLTDRCLDVLASARAHLATGHPEEAQALVLEAECLLEQAAKSQQTLRRWGPFIGIYELALLALLAILARVVSSGPAWASETWGWLPPPAYVVWGALGGVVAALFGFYIHAARRDFDSGYIAYYFLKPVLGAVLGPLIYLFARAGLMATQGANADVQSHHLLYLGAFVLGFGERFSLRLIDRVAGAIFGPAEPARAAAPGATAALPTAEVPPGAAGLPAAPPTRAQLRVRVTGPPPDELSDVSATLKRGDDVVEVKGPPPDEATHFLFGGLAPGEYELTVSKPGWRQVAEVRVGLETDEAAAEEEVVLEPEAGPEEGD